MPLLTQGAIAGVYCVAVRSSASTLPDLHVAVWSDYTGEPHRDLLVLSGGHSADDWAVEWEDHQPFRVLCHVSPHHLSAYGFSKVVVSRLREILSLELADKNVQVNAVGPGSINIRMWEQIRDGAEAAGNTEL